MTSNPPLHDQVAIVTGAGRRLGRMHARTLAAAGARVVVNDVEADRAERVVTEIAASGGKAVSSVASVMTADGAQAIVDRALETYGTVDAVVNNAGFMRSARFEDLTVEMFDEVLAIHVGGAFHVSQAAWPLMKAKGYGRIVMTSSAMGLFAAKGAANYAAAKAGVFGMTRALACEGEEFGIAVNCILPHGNPLQDDNPDLDAARNAEWYLENWALPGFEDYVDEEIAASLEDGRRDAALVSPMVAYLASPACRVTGEAFAAGFGRFSRVFAGECAGWKPQDAADATVEGIARHMDAIRSTDRHEIPINQFEEMRYLARLGEEH